MKRTDGILTRFFEVSDPLIALAAGVATRLAVAHYLPAVNASVAGDRTTLYGPLAGVFGSLLGFIIAAFSIVVSMLSNERLTAIRRSGNDVRVWRAFLLSTVWCASATLAPIVALVIDRNGATPGSSNNPTLLAALVFVTLAASLSIYRCVTILYYIGLAIRSRSEAS